MGHAHILINMLYQNVKSPSLSLIVYHTLLKNRASEQLLSKASEPGLSTDQVYKIMSQAASITIHDVVVCLEVSFPTLTKSVNQPVLMVLLSVG